MTRLLALSGICTTIVCLSILIGNATAYRRVCYVTNRAQYRESPAQWFPENLDASLCTHAIFAFANVVENDLKPSEWNDHSAPLTTGMYDRLNNLKIQHQHLKTLLAIDSKTNARPFTAMIANTVSRREFANNTVKYLREWKFDGLDVHWQYPANAGNNSSPHEDRERFVMLLQDLRRAFDAEAVSSGNDNLLLGIAGHAGKAEVDAGYDVQRIAKVVDFIGILSYDYHAKSEGVTGMNAPLSGRAAETASDEQRHVEFSADYYVRLGAPREKLNIGLAMYGHSFTLANANDHGIGAPIHGDGHAGRYTRESGFLAYYEICQMLQHGATRYWHDEHQAPYAVLGNQWVGYDDPESLQLKIDYIKRANYGGVMMWTADLDDFQNLCRSGPYPLMRTVRNLLNGTGPLVTTPRMSRPSSYTDAATPITPAARTTTSPSIKPHGISTADFSCAGRQDGFYPNPVSCVQYYWCVLRTVLVRTCPHGLLFDTRRSQCFYGDRVNCTDGTQGANWTTGPVHTRITTATTEPTTAPSTTIIPAFNCQGRASGRYPDTGSCTSYFICASGTKYDRTCLDGLLFDTTLNYCTFANQVDCGSRPRPTKKRRSSRFSHIASGTNGRFAFMEVNME